MKAVIGGALAVLVLALVTLSVVQRVKEARDKPVVTPISADAYYALGGALTCDSELHEVPHLPLEAEPVALLVCADPAPIGSVPWTSPDDLVEGDLTALVDTLADLEPTPDEPYDCTFQGGPAYDLLLRFSRDRYARIHGDTGGCGVVTVASGEWFGANEVLDAALALVEEQREAPSGADRDPRTSRLPRRRRSRTGVLAHRRGDRPGRRGLVLAAGRQAASAVR